MERWTRALVAAVAAASLTAACSDTIETDDTTRDDTGTITGGGELSTFEIRVGDCFNTGSGDQLATVDAVPCDEPHVHEAFLSFELTGDDFPGVDAVTTEAESRCQDGFEPYVGREYESSELYLFVVHPTADTWEDQDDREVICTLVTEDESPRTGSARGSGI